MSVKKKQTYFDSSWLVEEELVDWLVPVKDDNTKYRCKVCRKTNELSNMGKRGVLDHMKGEKHIESMKKIKNFFVSKKGDSEVEVVQPTSSRMQQQKIDVSVKNSSVAEAEIRWVLKCTMAGYSNNSNNDVSDLFSLSFYDSDVAKKYQLGPDKIRYSINFGLGPHFKEILMVSVKKALFHVLSFDEALCTPTQSSEMNLLVRYLDKDIYRVSTRYVTSEFLGHCRHTDLYANFVTGSKDMDENKLLQVSMDGPNVNLKFLELLMRERKANGSSEIFRIGTCGLHTIHGAFASGAIATDWKIKQTLKYSHIILHDSTARRDDYEAVTNSKCLPLPFCVTRWIEDKPVSDRLIQLWPNMKMIMAFWGKLAVSKQPKNKSYEHLKTVINDNLMIARLGFFSFLADLYMPFLTAYQTDKPMMPYLYDDLYRLLKNILSVIYKPSVVDSCSTAYQLMKNLDLEKKENFKDDKDIDIGFVASTHINKLKRCDDITGKDVCMFYDGCKKFVKTSIIKMKEKIPVTSKLVRNANALNPQLMAISSKSNLFNRFQMLVTCILEKERMEPQDGDKAVSQYKSFLEDNMDNIKKFKKGDTRLDEFFYSVCGIHERYPELSVVVELILVLSHGQASAERNFSLGKSVVVNNISEMSIVHKKIIKDHMQANNLTPTSINITKEMLKAFKGSRMEYDRHLEAELKKKKLTEKNEEKKIIEDEIKALKLLIEEKKMAVSKLKTEAFSAMELSATEKDSRVFAIKAVSLKRSADETEQEIISLEKSLELLATKRNRFVG